MFGPNSILDMAKGALLTHQACIQVTGENIANVDTPGYARRGVTLAEAGVINYTPGQVGLGVEATQVIRYFDEMVERLYYDQSALASRWDTTYASLSSVETMFNESDGYGISNSLSEFFTAWTNLSQSPEDTGSRQELINSTDTLCSLLSQTDSDLSKLQQQADEEIAQEIDTANQLIQDIAELDRQLNLYDQPGSNNANNLYDQRATKLRDLADIMGINVIDNGSGNITVTTEGGQVLVDGVEHYSLEFTAAQTRTSLTPTSNFDGEAFFTGNDTYEYTLQCVDAGYVSNGAAAAQFRVSLDGGRTWLTGEDGQELHYSARPEDGKIQIGGLTVWFGTADDPTTPGSEQDPLATPTQPMSVGDTFTIIPKKNIYWVKNTSTKENITPLQYANGDDDTSRICSGTLAGLFNFRDNYLGSYQDKLDALSESLVWEVNRLHSQGAGLEKFGIVEGTYSVAHDDRALGEDSTGLVYGDKLQSGSSMFYVYNADTGLLVSGASLDWSAAAGVQNFDPTVNTLEDVADAFNRTFSGAVTATIVNHKLQLKAADGYQFAFGTDSTGLMAALGLNTFFQGSTAQDIAVNEKLGTDLDYICAGHVNGAGEANAGDNTISLALSELQDMSVRISTLRDGVTNQTLSGYYNSLVGDVGADVASAQYSYEFNHALASDLDTRQQEAMGVNLDEEMTNLIKFQHAYTAAAKLVTLADEMMQTLLSLKS
ncbi:MAG TPA: flagellar hook-associated protein FlgK [Desulfovibrio sp.]|nr:flagellar hook-associated protein FlgK [Desulfovibrio sp.]